MADLGKGVCSVAREAILLLDRLICHLKQKRLTLSRIVDLPHPMLGLLAFLFLAGCGSGPNFPRCPDTEPGPISDLPPPAEDKVHLVAVGDILLDREVGQRIKQNGVHSILPVVAPELQQADIAFANLECPIATVGAWDP